MTLAEFMARADELAAKHKAIDEERRQLALDATDAEINQAVVASVLKMGNATLTEIRRSAGRPIRAWTKR